MVALNVIVAAVVFFLINDSCIALQYSINIIMLGIPGTVGNTIQYTLCSKKSDAKIQITNYGTPYQN